MTMKLQTDKWLAVLTLIGFFTILDLTGTLVSLVVHKNRNVEQARPVCVQSPPFLSKNEKDFWNGRLLRQSENNVEKYCASSQEQMSALLELVHQSQTVNNRKNVTYDSGNVSLSDASAHKRLLPSVLYRKSSDLDTGLTDSRNIPLTLNSSDSSVIEHSKSVEVLPTGYHILLSGIYYIYSSIHFKQNSNMPCRKGYTWRQNVVRIRPNERQSSGILLSSVHSCCDDCPADRKTSYTGGAFLLQAGDHLHIELSGDRLVSFERESSYFGVRILGSGLS